MVFHFCTVYTGIPDYDRPDVLPKGCLNTKNTDVTCECLLSLIKNLEKNRGVS